MRQEQVGFIRKVRADEPREKRIPQSRSVQIHSPTKSTYLLYPANRKKSSYYFIDDLKNLFS
jgi:hypothetical protein